MMTSAATVALSITRKSGRRGKLTLRTLDRPGVSRLIPIHPQFPKWYAYHYGIARTGRSRQGRYFKVKWAFPSTGALAGGFRRLFDRQGWRYHEGQGPERAGRGGNDRRDEALAAARPRCLIGREGRFATAPTQWRVSARSSRLAGCHRDRMPLALVAEMQERHEHKREGGEGRR
jgi:hypothetical protein